MLEEPESIRCRHNGRYFDRRSRRLAFGKHALGPAHKPTIGRKTLDSSERCMPAVFSRAKCMFQGKKPKVYCLLSQPHQRCHPV